MRDKHPEAVVFAAVLIGSAFFLMLDHLDVCDGSAVSGALSRGEAFSCLEYWVNRYQTLVGALTTVLAAIVAWVAVQRQLYIPALLERKSYGNTLRRVFRDHDNAARLCSKLLNERELDGFVYGDRPDLLLSKIGDCLLICKDIERYLDYIFEAMSTEFVPAHIDASVQKSYKLIHGNLTYLREMYQKVRFECGPAGEGWKTKVITFLREYQVRVSLNGQMGYIGHEASSLLTYELQVVAAAIRSHNKRFFSQ